MCGEFVRNFVGSVICYHRVPFVKRLYLNADYQGAIPAILEISKRSLDYVALFPYRLKRVMTLDRSM